MKKEEAVALLERYSNYDGMGIPNLAGCKEAMRVAVDALKEACPEIAESEDERIRKEIIDFIQWAEDRGMTRHDYHQAKRPAVWIDYLEKQKEQKPVEWSEEDEDMLNSCISSIEEAKENRYAYKETDGDTSYDHEIAWLKSLRPQPKQEWSEEDEDFINMLILHFNYLIDKGGDSVETYKSYIEKLKSLRPSWKPSKEQMKALEDAFRKDGSDEYRKTINSLYQQLKKL